MKDFFISYTRKDRAWAEWIAWHLEAAGYSTVIQVWDFRPGSNFVTQMQQATVQAARTIAVLSPNYLASQFTLPEWAAAFAQDPTGSKGVLVPIRVQECDLTGLLPQVVYIDLVGIDEAAALECLVAGVNRSRAKPSRPPRFPGTAMSGNQAEPAYPALATAKRAPSRKTTTTKAPPSQKAEASEMADPGSWVLLNSRLFQSISVVERPDGRVEVQVAVQTPGDDAELRALHPDRYNRSAVSYAYQNDAFAANVQSAERASTKGKSVWTVILTRADDQDNLMMDVSFNGVTPDEIAEMRARLLLLNEKPALGANINDRLLKSAIDGYGIRNNEGLKGIFPALWKQCQESKIPFLPAAHLWAVYHIKTTHTCEHILELGLGPVRSGKLPVQFIGKRKRTYTNVEPATIKVKGTCLLSLK